MTVRTLRDWLDEHPPADSEFRQSLAGVADRTRRGGDFFGAVGELLDEFALLRSDAQRRAALETEPAGARDGAALEGRGVTGELYMVGGAATAIAFDERRKHPRQ